MFTQSIKFYLIKYYFLFEKCDSSNSKNEWLLPASFMEKFRLVFVLTLENPFSWRFHVQASRKSVGSSKKTVLGIFKISLRLRDRHIFM